MKPWGKLLGTSLIACVFGCHSPPEKVPSVPESCNPLVALDGLEREQLRPSTYVVNMSGESRVEWFYVVDERFIADVRVEAPYFRRDVSVHIDFPPFGSPDKSIYANMNSGRYALVKKKLTENLSELDSMEDFLRFVEMYGWKKEPDLKLQNANNNVYVRDCMILDEMTSRDE